MTLLTLTLVALAIAGVMVLGRRIDRHGPRTSAQAEYEAFAKRTRAEVLARRKEEG